MANPNPNGPSNLMNISAPLNEEEIVVAPLTVVVQNLVGGGSHLEKACKY